LARGQLSTPDHLADPGFWPTKSLPRSEYTGSAACAPCHPTIFAVQPKTSMARTAQHADASDVIRSHNKLTFQTGPYRYQITSAGERTDYGVSTDQEKLHATLQWSFGTGRVGQSYLYHAPDNSYREAKVTFFSSLDNLNFTPDRAFTNAKDIDEAMYRIVSRGEAGRCFGCHTTASMVNGEVEEKNLYLGVTCEACHGPGAKHVAVMQSAQFAGTAYSGPSHMINPDSLDPLDSVDFCGACHATWWDVKLAGTKGVTNARSQPYRLELSKCWGKGDKRLTCMGCHDPHYQLDQVAEHYDHVCLSCHNATGAINGAAVAEHTVKICPVGTKACSSCHMPKVLVPEMQYKFTDHKIQISRPGDTYTE
jgi:Cytochrome c554 and c-prime